MTMKMFHISIILFVLLVNIIFPVIVRRNIISKFRKTHLVEDSLYKLKIFQQYIQTLIIVVSVFVFSFSLSDILDKTEFNRIVLLLSPFIFILVLLILNQIIYHKVYTIIRGIETTLKEETANILKSGLALLMPSLIIVFTKMQILNRIDINQYISIFIIIALIIIINMLYPYVIKFTINAVPMKSIELRDSLLFLLEKHRFKRVKIYEWSSTKNKVANALVGGLFEKKIFISDYLIKNLEIKEIEAILAHEIGHLKKFHIWIRVALIILAYPLFTMLGYFMDEFEPLFHIKIPIVVGIIFVIGMTILYFSLVFMLFTRMQERQADEYAIGLGIDINVFSSALMKLAKLNDSVEKLNRVDEKFQTHPSFENRIKWLKRNYH
jgi:STE24 endopeptidase